jgi:hypothetical protein
MLKGQTSADYGDRFRDHTLEIYKIYLEMADRISARRQTANSFFLTINTALIGFLGYTQIGAAESPTAWTFVFGGAGVALCYLWYRIILSYKQLNSAKFKVIHEIEKSLPLRPYYAEWESVGRGNDPKLYRPFTRVEIIIPWLFAAAHAYVILQALPWHLLSCGAAR